MNRENLLLSFLYANNNEKVEGTIKLMKQLFLIENQKGASCFYNFEPYDLGPVSFQVYSDLNELKDKNIIREEKQGKVSVFSLTPIGILLARDIFNNLNSATKDIVIKIKREFNQRNKDDVVLYVYKNFPSFTFRSKYNAYWRK